MYCTVLYNVVRTAMYSILPTKLRENVQETELSNCVPWECFLFIFLEGMGFSQEIRNPR